MNLVGLTDGAVSGTATVSLGMVGRALGGVAITADGTNNATVVVRRNSSTGKVLFHMVTKSPLVAILPVHTDGATQLHYSISGTGGLAMIYEWVD